MVGSRCREGSRCHEVAAHKPRGNSSAGNSSGVEMPC